MQQEWPNEEEKEQSSPVSILDCPFQDEEEDIGSPFQRSLIRVEGILLSISLQLPPSLSLSLSLSQSHTHTHTQTEFPHFMKILIKSGDFAIK
jgi:hypothetical protein